MNAHKLLFAIVLVAAIFRLWQLNVLPVSLNWDEVSHGYNAYAIANTGKDEWGITMPLIFRCFGDFKLPAYIYLTAIWSLFLGLTPFAIRLTSALSGIAAVACVYYLVQNIASFHSQQSPWLKKHAKAISLSAAFLLAIEPWNLFLSRVAVEANVGAFFFLSGIAAFYKGLNQLKDNKKAWAFLLSGILWGMSLFSYNSFRIFTPAMVTLLALIYWAEWGIQVPWPISKYVSLSIKKSEHICPCFLYGFALFLLCFTAMSYQMLFTSSGQARASNIFVIDQGIINQINEHRGASNVPVALTKIIYNKLTYTIFLSSQNYTKLLNPTFWYLKGGNHYQFSVPGKSLLFPSSFPLLIIGLYACKFLPRQVRVVLLGWLILAPLPASVTRDNPHVLRIITLSPFPQIIAALGLIFIIQKIKQSPLKIIGISLFVVLNLYQLQQWWGTYNNSYNKSYAWAWQDGTKQLVRFLQTNYDAYDRIYITKKYGEPHEFILFYWPWDPIKYHQTVRWEYRDANTPQAWYWVHEFDKFRFVNDWEINQVVCPVETRCLFIDDADNPLTPDNPLPGPTWKKQGMITGSFEQNVFTVYKNTQ